MARTRHQITTLGKILDPIADKLLIGIILVYIIQKFPIAIVFLAILIIETIGVLAGSLLKRTLGPVIGANVFGKIKMIFQSLAVILFLTGLRIDNEQIMKISIGIFFIALLFAILSAARQIQIKVRSVKRINNQVK
jgi:CDP-diacylglycerol--glycerol-3-phosphate 3-phosphatidyltransferase